MKGGRIMALNLGALFLTFAASISMTRWEGRVAAVDRGETIERPAFVRDATGAEVPVRPYERVATGSHVADTLAVMLLEHGRVIAVSGHGIPGSPHPQQFDGIEVFGRLHDVEALIALGPDLVVVNNFVYPAAVTELRAAGLEVFDLGRMHGLESLLEQARTLATLLDVPERGERFAKTFETRMRAVAADIPPEARPRGIYLGTHGSLFFGGTRGTSYHDVLTHGGLRDAAAIARYEGWPSYTSEELLEIDPEVMVTAAGKAALVCGRPGLESLRPCRGDGRVVELREALLLDPGVAMLEAAEELREAIHGPRSAP